MNKNNSTQNESEKHAIQPTPGEAITSLPTGNTYIIGGKIGEGNFGIVYSCKDEWHNDLAAKVFKPIATYDKVKANAEREFHSLVQLRHPCITFIYDAFQYRETFYIITERCHSPIKNLFNIYKFDGLVWLKPIARSLLQAVYYLHLNNYVHQDIHEGNIFTTFVKDEMDPKNAEVMKFKLGDLGVSKLFDEIDVANTRAQWMLPPEVLRPLEFGPIDRRIDIYHVGLLLLQIAMSVQIRFTSEDILKGRPRERALELPAPYNHALERALRRHVASRTSDALELWRDLNAPLN